MTGLKQFSKIQVATAVAILFHTVGLVGILIFENDLIIHSTPFNLLLCFALLIWTQDEKNKFFWLFVTSVLLVGFSAEVIGIHTCWLFGNYSYGNVLGYKFLQVPVMIGINWFIIIYCCGISIQALLQKVIKPPKGTAELPTKLKALSIVTDSATLAVTFDWIMEPVAVKLGFWKWGGDGSIPSYNYVCWFAVSTLLLLLFQWCRFSKENKFAVNLLLVQFMFFLLLRTFYHTH